MDALTTVRFSWEWLAPLTILAVRRCQPFWLDAGLPADLETRPEGVLSTTREFLIARGRVAEDTSVAVISEMLDAAIERLVGEYGDETARTVVRWADTYFVAPGHEQWSIWYRFLTDLVRLPPDGAPAPIENLPISSERRALISQLISARIGVDVSKQLRARLVDAERIPLSPPEEEILRIDPSLVEPGEIATPYPIGDVLRAVIDDHRAHRVSLELDAMLSVAERVAIVEWAQARARKTGLTLDRVGWPQEDRH